MSPPLISLGSINADFQVRVDEEPGERETLEAHDLRRLSGGKAANVAYLAHRLGHPALLLGRVGCDDLATQALGSLHDSGVDVQSVRRTCSAATAVSMIMVPPSGKKRIVLAGNANLGWEAEDIEASCAAIRTADPGALLVADFEIAPEAVRAALRTAHERGLRTVVDPSFPRHVGREDLRGVHALTPNESEARELAGVATPGARGVAETARALAALGPRMVCIKLSDGGCLVAQGERMEHVPAGRVEIVDATGAGDAFTGAFAVALLEGREPVQAAAFAVACSDLAVTGYGSQPAYPSREALDAHLKTVEPGVRAWPEPA
ncbi:ribokinase [Caldimonas tepidiphila]|uniref:ribokinase n=1 Tax=Caldimonas tepidiphila TaxID=2315841 RepID=UPI000E5C1F1B|nr:ribokinase [Caldimonas tepidiphila]